MSKDPAVLFYTSDFLSGTFTMTNEQVGKYIRLLCLQHQKGYLYENDMKMICGEYDEQIYSKFENKGGKFINIRMKEEAEKRRNYCESRGKNKKGKTKDTEIISKSYDKHMENENVNEVINKDLKENSSTFIIPTREECAEYFKKKDYDYNLGLQFFDYYDALNWINKDGKPVKNWKMTAIQVWFPKAETKTHNGKSKLAF
jgi:hypothetical protein